MDLKEVPTTNLLGDIVGFFAPMNGGKTEGVVQELKRAYYFGLNTIAYNNELNTRERNSIAIDGKVSYPAITVRNMADLRADFQMRRGKLEEYLGVSHGEEIAINGITHYKGYPLRAVGIDEINLFCLTEQDASETLDFMLWCKREKIAVFISGLLYDFRHFPFGYMPVLLPYVDIKQEKKPACMALNLEEIKCTNTAKHTQRVWSKEFVREQGLEQLVDQLGTFGFEHKDKQRFPTEFVPSPFFDQTVRIGETEQEKVMYLPVCTGCAKLPFKKETFEVYDLMVKNKVLPESGQGATLLSPILTFLLTEGWVRQEGDQYHALPYYRNKLGGFSLR